MSWLPPAVAAAAPVAFWAFILVPQSVARRRANVDWCTVTMEFGCTSVPRPGQTNPLVWILSPPNEPVLYEDEYEALAASTPVDVQRVQAVGGVLLGTLPSSVSIKLQFHGSFLFGMYDTGAVAALGSATSVGRRKLTLIPTQKCVYFKCT